VATNSQTSAKPKLTPLERELLIERAAIMEYDGNLPRAEAERRAWQDHENRKTKALLRGFTIYQHEGNGR